MSPSQQTTKAQSSPSSSPRRSGNHQNNNRVPQSEPRPKTIEEENQEQFERDLHTWAII